MSMLRRHPVLSFYLVIFSLTILGTLLAFGVFHGSVWVQWIAVCSPAVASLGLTGYLDGRTGVQALLASLFRWKVHWKWYLAVFLLPVLYGLGYVFCAALVDGRGLTAGLADADRWLQALVRGGPGILLMTVLMTALIVGEELGWRGFALDRLLKTRGPLFSSVIVGFFWGIWHFPSALDPTAVLNKAPLPYSFTLFTLGTIVFSFVYTWLWLNTRSLLLICLFHSFYDMIDYFTAALFPSFYVQFWLYLLVLAVVTPPFWALFRSRPGASAPEYILDPKSR